MKNDIPFDQYSRQKIVADILDGLRSGEKLQLIDIGGYKGKTQDFLPNDSVTISDLFDVDEKNYVKANGLELPFEDGAFDFSLSFDVLEHINKKGRTKFIKEALRVSRRGLILCAPHSTGPNIAAEKTLNDYYKLVHGKNHPWLQEHIAYGLPEMDMILSSINLEAYKVIKLYSNDVEVWSAMQSALFLSEKYYQGAKQLVKLNKLINDKLTYTCGQNPETSYRQITIILKDRSDAQKVKITNTAPITIEQKQKFFAEYQKYYVELIGNLMADSHKVLEELAQKNGEIKGELDAIKASKSWHAAQKLSKVKRLGRK